MIKLLESTGQMAASGRTGRSAQRLDDSMVAAWGRNNATKAASLASSKEGYQQQVEDIQRQQNDANESAFDQVAFAPNLTWLHRSHRWKRDLLVLDLL
jgi:hypothetical protein